MQDKHGSVSGNACREKLVLVRVLLQKCRQQEGYCKNNLNREKVWQISNTYLGTTLTSHN